MESHHTKIHTHSALSEKKKNTLRLHIQQQNSLL